MRTKVKSSTGTGEYTVDTMELSCTCPHYLYRLMGTGDYCKHVKEVLDNPDRFKDEEEMKEIKNNDLLLAFIENNKNAVEFVEKYSEKDLNKLKLTGQVFEKHGMLTVF